MSPDPWNDINTINVGGYVYSGEGMMVYPGAQIGINGSAPIRIDSINVRGTADFEDKKAEFAAVLAKIHAALMRRASEVRFLYGMGTGLTLAWRIALVVCILSGCLGVVAAIYSAQWQAAFGAAAFIGAGISGLAMLRGRKGPRPYDPATFVLPGRATTHRRAQ